MAIKLFGKDGSTIRQIKKLFGNDSGTIRNIKKLWAKDGDTVRLIFQTVKEWLISGNAVTFNPGSSEVVNFGVRQHFLPGATIGEYSGLGMAFSSPDIDNSSLNSTFIHGAESILFESESEWEILDNGFLRFNGTTGDYIGHHLRITLTLNEGIGSSRWNIEFNEFESETDTTGTRITDIVYALGLTEVGGSGAGDKVLSSSVGDYNETVTLTNGNLYGLRFHRVLGSSGSLDISNMVVEFSYGHPDHTIDHDEVGTIDVRISTLGPAEFSITNPSSDISDISGTFSSNASAMASLQDIRNALEAEDTFTDIFSFTETTTVPAITGGWDFQILSFPTLNSTTTMTLNLPTTNRGKTTSLSAGATIEDVIDTIVELGTQENGLLVPEGIIDITKISSDTVRISGDTRIPLATFNARFAMYLSPRSGLSGEMRVSATDINDSNVTITVTDTDFGSDTISVIITGSGIGNPYSGDYGYYTAKYTAKNTTDYEDFVYSITQNDGHFTDTYLEVTEDGEDPVPATIVTLTNPDESVSISTGTNADTVGATIADSNDAFSYDSGNDTLSTPLETTISITNPGTLTITEL